jgi:hypothetical protein
MKRPHRKTADELRRDARRATVDEYGDLLIAMAPHKPGISRLAALAKSIRDWFTDEDPTISVTAHGNHYEVNLSPCGIKNRIEDMQAVYDAMGHEDFLKACSITIGNLETFLSKGRAAALLIAEQTGTRDLTVTELDA